MQFIYKIETTHNKILNKICQMPIQLCKLVQSYAKMSNTIIIHNSSDIQTMTYKNGSNRLNR